MKKLCACLFVFALLCCFLFPPAEAAAAELTLGPYTYEVANGEVTITDCKATTAGTLSIPETIDGYPVTAIGDSAFFSCKKLTAITVPDGVTSIARFAFGYCSALQTLSIPSSVVFVEESAFSGCPNLTYNIYENIKYLGNDQSPYHILISANQTTADSCTIHPDTRILYDDAFQNCANLTAVTIPANVTVIGWETFSGCSSLSAITIPNKVVSIGWRAFYQCTALSSVTLPDSLTSLGKEAFADCPDAAFRIYGGAKYLGNEANPYRFLVRTCDSAVSDLSLHPDTRLIANGAFSVCKNLTAVEIPAGVTIIGEDAFEWSGLQAVTIPNSVATIGSGAFNGCISLTSVTLPNRLTAISEHTFHGCDNLTDIVIPDSVKTIGEQAFFACDKLASVTLGKGVATIEESAFHSTGLTQVTIPAGVTVIGQDAFRSCDNLTGIWVDENNPAFSNDEFGVLFNKDKTALIRAPGAISGNYTIPKTVTTLGESAFCDCTKLSSVLLSQSITAIPSGGFYRCSSLTTVVIPDSVKSVGEYAFQFCEKLKNVYYTGSEAQWSALMSATDSYNTYLLNATVHYNHEIQYNTLAVYVDRTNLRVATGEKITLRAVIVDENGNYRDASGITFQLSDSSLVALDDSGFASNGFYIQLRGVNPGDLTVTFSDSVTGYATAVPISIYENRYLAYTLSNVPNISSFGQDANFANDNGLYIDNYSYKINDDQSARVTFDVYNSNYIYGLVEVYTQDGQLQDAVLIDKASKDNTSLKTLIWDGAVCYAMAVADHSISTYKKFQHTSVKVDIPKNGYIKITCDPAESDQVMMVNAMHAVLLELSMIGDIIEFDPCNKEIPEAFLENMLKGTLPAQFKKDGYKFFTDLFKEGSKDLLLSAASVGSFTDAFLKRAQELNLIQFLGKSFGGTAIDIAEDAFLKYMGVYGAALEAYFIVGKAENLALSYNDLATAAGGGAITIQNQAGGLRAANRITLESQVDFAPDVALQTYAVALDGEFLEFIQQADQETYELLTQSICHTYNISLLQNGREVQHSDYVTVYIPIPEDLRVLSLAGNVEVYRIEEDGSFTDMDAVVEDGFVRFVTNHFSLYVLVGNGMIPGDLDGNMAVDQADVEYLLLHTLFGEADYPLDTAIGDIDGSGSIDQNDVIYLLLYTLFGDTLYPLLK